jgi:hypothetical protein
MAPYAASRAVGLPRVVSTIVPKPGRPRGRIAGHVLASGDGPGKPRAWRAAVASGDGPGKPRAWRAAAARAAAVAKASGRGQGERQRRLW